MLVISSGAAAIGMLGLWLFITFAVPSIIGWAANQSATMPSRLETIISIRQIQEKTNQQRPNLLTDWYTANSQISPPGSINALPREIAGLPETLEIDKQIRPLMNRFNQIRKSHFEFMERWSVFSPPLAMLLMADRLAGIDAPRYAHFIDEVDQFEDQWRNFFIPEIMGEIPISKDKQAQIPKFTFSKPDNLSGCWYLSLIQFFIAFCLFAVSGLSLRRFARI
jgi:ABC-2 type transport system permease protein